MFYEPNEHPYFLDLLSGKPGVFFDVGSHCGYYSLIAASKGFKVVAFEIMDELAKATKKNFQENSINGQVVKTAIGKGGEDIFFGDALSEKKLKAISLDDYAKSTGLYPDVIKMDIEGSELAALQGAHEVLSRKPALDISIHPHYLKDKGQSEKEVLDLLSDYGYKIICDFGDTYFMR